MSITLADLEREVARRVGPYFTAVHDPSRSGTARAAFFPSLQSGMALGEPENLWALRRSANAVDRQRLVQAYDTSGGQVIVERNWQQPPQPNEAFEFHHLDPVQELRPVVLAGLRRCFIGDLLPLVAGPGDVAVDLTETSPWLTSPRQVQDVVITYPTESIGTHPPFQVYSSGGHIWLTVGGYVLDGMNAVVRRPANTLVNGLDAANPTADDDELAVDLDYAAAAGHIEAWHLVPHRTQSAGAGGLQANQKMAALEFTRQTAIWAPYSKGRFQLSQPFGVAGVGLF